MKTCMFTGMFRKRTFREAVENAAAIGYNGVEIRFALPHMSLESTPQQLKELSDIVESCGLAPVSLYTFVGAFSTRSDAECSKQFEDFKKVLEAAQIFKTPMLKLECGGPNAFKAYDYHFEKEAHWMRKCAELAARGGTKIALEIHNQSLIEDIDHAIFLIDKIGMENVGLIHDAGNMYITGTDYGALSVQRLGKRLFHVHVKDLIRCSDNSQPDSFKNITQNGEEWFKLTRLNTGGVDHRPLIRALRESGYQGYLSTEANLTMDDMEMTKHEFSELQKMLSEQ